MPSSLWQVGSSIQVDVIVTDHAMPCHNVPVGPAPQAVTKFSKVEQVEVTSVTPKHTSFLPYNLEKQAYLMRSTFPRVYIGEQW